MVRTNFENLRVYQLSEEISDLIWEMVVKWKRLAQDTVGKQLIKAADSIGANRTALVLIPAQLNSLRSTCTMHMYCRVRRIMGSIRVLPRISS
jgi:hypothetical protein